MTTYPITQITAEDEEFPRLLLESSGHPKSLYLQGNLSVSHSPCISIVGSRKASAYGEKIVRLLVPSLVRAGLTIVSGLAYGIDSYAHTIALQEQGNCLAVLGSGLGVIYPRSNLQLAQNILRNNGCLLSEYAPEIPPLAGHFPARNRIVAALSPVVLIIEASERSGTLITARCALDAGREVCVVPGDITSLGSQGVMKLLQQGARPIGSVEDILQLYAELKYTPVESNFKPALTGSMATLYDLISCGTGTVNELCVHSGLDISELQSVISVLELDKYIYFKDNSWQKI